MPPAEPGAVNIAFAVCEPCSFALGYTDSVTLTHAFRESFTDFLAVSDAW